MLPYTCSLANSLLPFISGLTEESTSIDSDIMDECDTTSECKSDDVPRNQHYLWFGCNVEEAIDNSQCLRQLRQYLNELKHDHKQVRTGKLWLMFMEITSIVRMFIGSERSPGQWSLHLKATADMIPCLATAGHNNYTTCCQLYLQYCQPACPCIRKAIEDGPFTVRRNTQRHWSGTWTDMTWGVWIQSVWKHIGSHRHWLAPRSREASEEYQLYLQDKQELVFSVHMCQNEPAMQYSLWMWAQCQNGRLVD